MYHVCLVFLFLAKEAERHTELTEGKWFKTTLNRVLAIYTLLAWSDAKYPNGTHTCARAHTQTVSIYTFSITN
jgi:hypothetical protein